MIRKTVAPVLLKNRDIIEGNFVLSLWKSPELFLEYDIKPDIDFKTEAGKIFYEIGNGMTKRGIYNFDEISVETFLDNFPEYKKKFDEFGGYDSYKDSIKLIDPENIGYYYDELQKSNLLISLYKYGFNTDEDYELFSKVKCQNVYDYYIDKIETASIRQSNSGISIDDLVLTKQFIDECDSGDEMGISYGKACPILNGITMGIMSKEVMFFCGQSGTFKTSFSFSNFLMPLVDNGNKVCIISNEQSIREFIRVLAVMTLTKKFNYFGVNRKKLIAGGFTDEQRQYLYKASDFTEEQYRGKLFFSSIGDYDINNVAKIIRKKAREGVKVFLYDTFKSDNLSDEQFWGKLMQDSQDLLQIARKEDVSIILTYQLATGKQRERYLDATCLGASKGVKNICSQMILSRPLFPDEFTGEKNDIEPYRINFKEKDANGNPKKEKITIVPDSDSVYIVVFIEKSRTDKGRKQILYKVNGDFNLWNEIGYCNVKYV